MNELAIEARAIVEQWADETNAIPAGKSRDVLVNRLFVAMTQREAMIRKDYEEVLADKQRLIKKLDVLMGGTAKQPSLCDVVAYFPTWKRKIAGEAQRAVYAAVLKGLRSENDSTQLRAIIASVECAASEVGK